jgi:hypothetical protein
MSTTIEMLRAQCRIDIDDTTEDECLRSIMVLRAEGGELHQP